MPPKGQLGLFGQSEESALTRTRGRPEIDLKRIEADLLADAGGFKVKVIKGKLQSVTGAPIRVRCRETDKGVHITIDPRHIRTQGQLDQVVAFCQDSINWPAQY